jgi:hypothetical protein
MGADGSATAVASRITGVKTSDFMLQSTRISGLSRCSGKRAHAPNAGAVRDSDCLQLILTLWGELGPGKFAAGRNLKLILGMENLRLKNFENLFGLCVPKPG